MQKIRYIAQLILETACWVYKDFYIQIFQNLLFCDFWNFSIAAIFWQQMYGLISILMYRKLTSKVSKYCPFILQKPYVQMLDLMSKRGHMVLLLYFYEKP